MTGLFKKPETSSGAPETTGDPTQGHSALGQEGLAALDEAGLVPPIPPAEPAMVTYTCSARTLKIGPYKFVNGILSLTPEESAKFDRALSSPAVDKRLKHQIQKIDVSAADRIGRDYLRTHRVRGIDTSDKRTV